MTLPRISVITPTWNRHNLLLERCIPSVADQSYPNVEHIVISDGPDAALRMKIPSAVTYDEMPLHDPFYHWGCEARITAENHAAADLIAPFDDDDYMHPD